MNKKHKKIIGITFCLIVATLFILEIASADSDTVFGSSNLRPWPINSPITHAGIYNGSGIVIEWSKESFEIPQTQAIPLVYPKWQDKSYFMGIVRVNVVSSLMGVLI